jgi:hypothetical protein
MREAFYLRFLLLSPIDLVVFVKIYSTECSKLLQLVVWVLDCQYQ